MKALSIHPVFADEIFYQEKTVEVRSWKTDYRGDILICSTAKKFSGTIPGHALCVANLKDIVPMKKKHCKAAMMDPQYYNPDDFAWILDDVRPIYPFPVKGQLRLWECDQKIKFIKLTDDYDKNGKIIEKIFGPLIYDGDREEW